MWRKLFRSLLNCGLLLAMFDHGLCTGQVNPESKSYRRPSSILKTPGHLVIANRQSGTVSIVNLDQDQITEYSVGESLRDLVHLTDHQFLTVDYQKNQMIQFRLEAGKLTVESRTDVAHYPQSIAVSADGKLAYVSSLWSRQITCLQAHEHSAWTVVAKVDLDFAPGELLLIKNEQSLLVADHFGGKLAVIDCKEKTIQWNHQISGHNIRGLSLANDGKTIVLSHQMLNELAHTSRNDIHWGLLMSNDLRWIPVEAICSSTKELYQSAHMHPLGKENHAAGDPGNLAVAKTNRVVATISGVNEIAYGHEDDFWMKRIKVGKHPVDVCFDEDASNAYVINSFEDSVSVFNFEKEKIVKTISLGAVRGLTEIEQGEQLFFNAGLSHDGWMSCHSCHTDGHTNGGLNDNFTDGSFGAPKRVLSLLGRKNTAPFSWRGNVESVEDQIRSSIENTMKSQKEPDETEVQLLAKFIKQLPPPPSLSLARQKSHAATIQMGKNLFEAWNCNRCHAPPSYTTPATYDVKLKDEEGNRRFNPPSLLGVSQRDSYFHDGRAKSISEVFGRHRHQLPENASAEEIARLIEFLESL